MTSSLSKRERILRNSFRRRNKRSVSLWWRYNARLAPEVKAVLRGRHDGLEPPVQRQLTGFVALVSMVHDQSDGVSSCGSVLRCSRPTGAP